MENHIYAFNAVPLQLIKIPLFPAKTQKQLIALATAHCQIFHLCAFKLRRLSFMIASLFSKAHAVNASTCGSNDRARDVNAYSTLGGISGKTVRVTYPSSSNVRSVTVSIFCEMSGIARCNSLKTHWIHTRLSNVYITKSDHLSHNLAKTFRIGQSGKTASSITTLSITQCIQKYFTKK